MKHGSYSTLKETETRPGVFRRSFSGQGSTLSWSRLEPGHTPRPHSHPHEQIVYLVEGTAKFTVGDEEKVLEAGDLIVIPGGVEHFAETVGDQPVIDLSVFNPRRDDYYAHDEDDYYGAAASAHDVSTATAGSGEPVASPPQGDARAHGASDGR